jgi:ribonuclease PH
MRTLRGDAGVIAEAHGSARFQYGETMTLAAVYGPGQPRYSRHEEYNKATVEVNYNYAAPPSPSGSSSGADTARIEREGARQIRQILQSCIDVKACPRMLIVVEVTVLRNDGAALATAVNACVLALLDSGIPMLYAPMALTCLSGEGLDSERSMLDTSAQLEESASSVITYAFRMENDSNLTVVLTTATGIIDSAVMERSWAEVCTNASTLKNFFGRAIRR